MLNFTLPIPGPDSDEEPGDVLAWYRKSNGLSQDELGEKVGRTKWGIVNFEKNFNAIHYEDACAFGRIFNVAPEVFMNEYSRFCTPGYGKRIVAIRNSYGVSQEEFADLIGVRRDMECLWETEYHQHRPSRESFERIKLLAEQQGMELERLIEDPEAYADDYIRFIEKDCPKKIWLCHNKWLIFDEK